MTYAKNILVESASARMDWPRRGGTAAELRRIAGTDDCPAPLQKTHPPVPVDKVLVTVGRPRIREGRGRGDWSPSVLYIPAPDPSLQEYLERCMAWLGGKGILLIIQEVTSPLIALLHQSISSTKSYGEYVLGKDRPGDWYSGRVVPSEQ